MIYESATEPAVWEEFLKLYTEVVGADFSVLQIHDLGRRQSKVISSYGLAIPFTKAYNEHYSKLNIWRDRGSHLYVQGRVNLDDEYCPRAIFERSEFYNDYMRHVGGVYSMAAVVARQGVYAPTVAAMRRGRKFESQERSVPRMLLPHLMRAWTVFQRLELLTAGESVLDTLPVGVLFIESSGNAIYWNRAADEIFRSNDGLTIRKGSLSVIDRKAGGQLRKAIDDALSPSRPPEPKAVLIPRPSALRKYRVVSAPLFSRGRLLLGMPVPHAVVLIHDPEREQPDNAALLIELYRLTRKEAALAMKLSNGKSLNEAAEELRITYETARTHLRRIFSKTGTSRQTELLLLIARLPSWPKQTRDEDRG
jgi:DNA-binding CsgD family transcriptional regulator